MKVAIIGKGWVGTSMKQMFPDAYVYTHRQGKKSEVNKADIVFIAVPTPLGEGGFLDTSIIESILEWIKVPLIVIRSTVNPGDCYRWEIQYGVEIVMQPEYLGETPNHPLIQEDQTPFIILGGDTENTQKVIELYTGVYNANTKIRQVTTKQAEIIKLTENRAIGYKVMQLHELYKVCEMANEDYYTIRDAVYGDDPRFNLWFSFIYPDKLGFENSKCLSKDIPAWCAWAQSVGFDPELTLKLVAKSKEYAKV